MDPYPPVAVTTPLTVAVRIIRNPLLGDQHEDAEIVQVAVRANDTIATLKQMLAIHTGISVRRQRLVLAGRRLQGNEAIGAPGGAGFMGPSGERVALLLRITGPLTKKPRRQRREWA